METNKNLGDGAKPAPTADPTAIPTPAPVAEPYKVFNDKEDLTNFIKKTLKEFKEENETMKKELASLTKQKQLDNIKKDLSIFNDDIKDIVAEKIDFSKDIKEQIDEIKEKHPSFLKDGLSITNKGKEKKEKNTITDGNTKVFL